MEGHLDGSSKTRSRTFVGQGNSSFEKKFTPLTPAGSNGEFRSPLYVLSYVSVKILHLAITDRRVTEIRLK